MYIICFQLSDFIADLDDPLGIEKPNEIALASLSIPILRGENVHCLDILCCLVKVGLILINSYVFYMNIICL